MRARKVRWRIFPLDGTESWVYFARVGKYLKVGHSTNPVKRVQRLRSDDTGRPLDLDKKAPIELLAMLESEYSADAERAAHEALEDFAAPGGLEWFIAEPAVLAWIASLDGVDYPRLDREGGPYVPTPLTNAERARADAEMARLLDRAKRKRGGPMQQLVDLREYMAMSEAELAERDRQAAATVFAGMELQFKADPG